MERIFLEIIEPSKKKYEYLTITRHIQFSDLEDCLEICDESDLEAREDDEMAIFLKVSQMKNLKEMEYLVLKLMGYEFFEMPEILNVRNLNGVYQVGNKMKSNFGKIEKVGF